jgi:hypothetical protein
MPDEIANTVLFLCSDLASAITCFTRGGSDEPQETGEAAETRPIVRQRGAHRPRVEAIESTDFRRASTTTLLPQIAVPVYPEGAMNVFQGWRRFAR